MEIDRIVVLYDRRDGEYLYFAIGDVQVAIHDDYHLVNYRSPIAGWLNRCEIGDEIFYMETRGVVVSINGSPILSMDEIEALQLQRAIEEEQQRVLLAEQQRLATQRMQEEKAAAQREHESQREIFDRSFAELKSIVAKENERKVSEVRERSYNMRFPSALAQQLDQEKDSTGLTLQGARSRLHRLQQMQPTHSSDYVVLRNQSKRLLHKCLKCRHAEKHKQLNGSIGGSALGCILGASGGPIGVIIGAIIGAHMGSKKKRAEISQVVDWDELIHELRYLISKYS